MVPRLSRGTEDCLKWNNFIDLVKQFYDADEQVEIGTHAIKFKAGEHPSLPVEGHKFLRFSSKVSGRIARETGVEAFIQKVTIMAKASFGARIQFWDESDDQLGFYDWTSVHASIKSYMQVRNAFAPPLFSSSDLSGYFQARVPAVRWYHKCPMRQRYRLVRGGLVAKVNIPKGMRILCEKPLLIVASMPPHLVHDTVARKLKTLSKNEQRQLLSLHNNFPGQYAFDGIVRTNALPCGPNSRVGGVYPKICLINHSCIPNAHNNWNEEAQHETIHAVRDISVGEEIMISYDMSLPSDARWVKLKASFGFQCPCHDLFQVLKKEYGDAATALLARLYYDAFQITAAHGDQARASAFAEKTYMARVECEGEDSPLTQKVKDFMQNPTKHITFGAYSNEWKSAKTGGPKKLDAASFEKWLWKLSN
ncbi:hypothetical protein BKA67DRAFT_528722 [Truncatella angustata]|uniref:SET domain-containing protein n=1 Tax=Truncatella angustata TaxID=152316 RepID=A0A9P8UAI0_9PEZI|nr:uncharacterized protein BKA67DRAFT_528722 [Truncatella angustata]KAH6638513.1 hypothetical protein BKA67DRAFT_528722 [Truncatella angustata]